MSSNSVREIKTCGLLIIGDEILKAQVKDTNSSFICKQLRDFGIKVSRIAVIPDDVAVIAKEVQIFSAKNHYVITTGGIGPTHDDVTYESLALAFNQSLSLNQDLLKFWTEIFPLEIPNTPTPNDAAYKFSNCPSNARVIFTEPANSFAKKFPVLNIGNVFVFPGTPAFVEKCFPLLLGKHILSDNKFFSFALYLSIDEVCIVDILNDCVNRHTSVIFGSYPLQDRFNTKITLEALEEEDLQQAKRFLTDAMSSYVNVYETLKQNESLQFAKHSLEVIEQCIDTYSINNVFLSFNGGKDCTLLLHLIMAVIKHKNLLRKDEKLLAVYFKIDDSFPEVETFVQDSVKRYNLDLVEMTGPMKEGLTDLLKKRPHLKAVFMGSRRGDPKCQNLTDVSKTDNGWPEILRIMPILDWTYPNVWEVIREFSIPYCTLYDQGYSSLGSSTNTTKNPALVKVENGVTTYLPPDFLKDDVYERQGRH